MKGLRDTVNDRPLIHHIVEMMCSATTFMKMNYQVMQRVEPYQNDNRNKRFGNCIPKLIDYPEEENLNPNCLEHFSGGFKSRQFCGFGSHLDLLNPQYDLSYMDVLVLSEVVVVPANKRIPFGNGECFFPYAIFCNRLGCETTMMLDNNIDRWLFDVQSFIQSLPNQLQTITSSCLHIDTSIEEVNTIIERNDEMYCHRKAHVHKHVQLSSFCFTLARAKEELIW